MYIIVLKDSYTGGEYPMADLKAIGKRIQTRRKQLGFSQELLADKMNVSIQMISNLERGNKSIRIDNLINLCQILDVSTDYILTGKKSTIDTHALTEQIEKLPHKEQKMIELLVEYYLSETN